MVSKASDDFPDPDKPVMTVSLSRGMVTSMFLRLCARAPRTMRASSAITRVRSPPGARQTSGRIGESSGGALAATGGGGPALRRACPRERARRLPVPAAAMPDATVVVLTTLASEEEAVPFVRTLLDLRLIACGTILPP